MEIEISSVDEAEAMQIDEAPPSRDWRDRYLNWINREELPSDHALAWHIARRAKSFVLIDREIYKHSPLGCFTMLHPHPRGQGTGPRHPC